MTRCAHVLGVAILTVSALVGVPMPAASAEPSCPDVEAVFARGSGEPPGVGGVGQSFIDALRAQIGDRSLNVYPVNYPASTDFTAGIEFAATVVEGIRDAANHVQATAANCPNTRIVLGGFSQGAAVAGFVTSAVIPEGVPAAFVPPPMPPEVANHVAAVTLFGKPSDNWLRDAGAPTVVIGPLYVPKTIDLCADGDTICNGAPLGGPTLAHASYGFNGMVNQAAEFAAKRI
jgi:hypothetical protein